MVPFPPDDVPGPLAHLGVDPADVFTDDAHAGHGDPHEEEVDVQQGKDSFRLGADDEAAEEKEEDEEEAQDRHGHADHGHRLERKEGEPRHEVEIEADEPEKTVLRRAVLPLVVPHGDLHGIDRELLGQGGDEGGALAALVDDVDDVPPVPPEHAAVIVQTETGDPVGDGIDDPGRHLAEFRVLPVLPDRPHHVVPLVDLRHDPGDFLRGVLKVGVEGDDDIPTGVVESGHDGHVLAEISVEVDDPDGLRVRFVKFVEHLEGPVPAAVVHEDDFMGTVHSLKGRPKAGKKMGKAFFLVVDRYDH
ncbi:hypothetical protein SDC9_41449 [bioreactor metagenome]|uniref:Uncharacterized protein n=1 Tax=bioreactor metagenome TaxID=1076179 RepID=A0A644VV36_9ZZZZ